ncbi:MAG: large-conductance mechanosensitive channel protein MscL [Bacteroidota bacterium]
MKKLLTEFKEFATRGNVVDMAVGIILGTAFGAISQSLVSDVLMPPIGYMLGNVDFSDLFVVIKQGDPLGPYTTLAAAQQAGAVTLNYGLFINNILSFLIVAAAMFLLVRGMNNMRRKEEHVPAEEPITKTCPHCLSTIPLKATRCPMCTSDLDPENTQN